MGTKNNPGMYDCYGNAAPDEPVFVLRGSDTTAALVVTFWRALKMQMVQDGTSSASKEKLEEARTCSLAMEEWAKSKGKDPKLALEAMKRVLAKSIAASRGT